MITSDAIRTRATETTIIVVSAFVSLCLGGSTGRVVVDGQAGRRTDSVRKSRDTPRSEWSGAYWAVSRRCGGTRSG